MPTRPPGRPPRRGGSTPVPSRRGRPGGGIATDPARRAALDVLRAVADRDAYANLVLPALLRQRRLDGRDAALATELAYGTLRAQGRLDAVLAATSSRPLDQIDPPVLDVLRLGAYQLLHTRIPAHAAVHATIDLARAVTGERATGFVNAVLRRVADRDGVGWLAALAPPYADDPVGHLAFVHSHPRWVVAAFRDALGGDLEQTAAALAADNARPQVHLVARPGRIGPGELLAAAGPAGAPGLFSPYAVRLTGGDPAGLAAVRDGRAGVQDEGSQLCALALAAAPLHMAGPDRRWLDLCAGPGGKAALLAGLAAERGAALLAVDRAPQRAGLVARALAGSGAATLTVAADATVPAWQPGQFDRVLVDAPCTGLGALRRRPEARWRRCPADVATLGRLQRALLGVALDALRPGGVAGYVVCSPHPAETALVVADTLRARAGVEQLDARALLPGVPQLGAGPAVQLWPHRHGTDAMFLTLLRRAS